MIPSRLGLIEDHEIDLAEAALDLALPDHPGTDLAPYRELLDRLQARLEDVGQNAVTADERAKALAAVLGGEFGFAGDSATYDAPDNADMIRVIDRRQGLPVSLCILWIAAARRLQWAANMLDLPGHVLVLVGSEPDGVIVDPFAGGSRVDGKRLAELLQVSASNRAVTHVETMSNRAVLVRLLQNQASRAEQAGRGSRALELYVRMTETAPNTVHAWLKRARLQVLSKDREAARNSLVALLEVTRKTDIRNHVHAKLRELR